MNRKQISIIDSNDEYLLRFISENVHEAINISQDGRVKFANRKVLELFGCTLDELTSRPFVDFIHPDDRDMVYERYQKRLKGEEITSYPYRIIDKEGNVKYMEMKGAVVLWNGRPATLNFVMDITARLQAEEELRKSEKRFFDIINFLPDATFAIDNKGTVIAWNKSIEELTGVPASHMLGQKDYLYAVPFYGKARPMLIDLIFCPFKKYETLYPRFRREKDILFAETIVTMNGSELCLWCKASAIYDENNARIGAIESLRDITEPKRAREELNIKTKNLEELNTALKVLLSHREQDKKEIEEKFIMNMNKLIIPYVEKLKISKSDSEKSNYIEILEKNLEEITSSFVMNIGSQSTGCTPREVEIAQLVKTGKTSKEIADILNISVNTVNVCRGRIRKKLGLNKEKTNLRLHLSSFQ